MTKEERQAFEYGKTFDVSNVPEGYNIACCFDERMKHLVSNARTEKGHRRNERNMTAWYNGFNSK